MGTPVVTLAGVPIGGQNAYSWPLVDGVDPVEQVFSVTLSVFDELKLFMGAGSTSPGLVYQVSRDGEVITKQAGLFIVDAFPGLNAFTKRIRVVDRRWFWGRRVLAKSYNVRRVTGDSVVVADGQNAETPDLLPEVRWIKPTLRDEAVAWTADEVIDDVFREVDGFVPRRVGDFDGLPVDDLVLDDTGAAAIERVLAFLPGAAVYIDHDGRPVVKDKFSGDERAVYERLKDLQQDNVTVGLVDRRWARPSKVVVYFTPELEMRFDYEEAPTGTITNSEDTNRLYNVGQVTDSTGLTINSQTYGPGSWVKLEDLFTAWGVGPGKRLNGAAARQLSFDICRLHVLSSFRYLYREFVGIGGGGTPDGQWSRRLAATTAAYRRTFRVARDMMSRFASIRPVRTAIISPNLGARASSPVYSDYMMRPSHKGFSTTSGSDSPAGVAVRGYADLITSDAAPAPVHIRAVNPEAGIFELVPKQTDTKGFYEGVFLGYPDTSSNNLGNPAAGMPTQSLGAAGLGAGPVTKLAFALGWDWVDLEADWKFSTVMSVVPNSPNSNQRLYKVEVTASELGEPDALGPPIEVRVYPGVVSARFAWLDEEADTIVPRIRGEGTGWPSQLVNRRAVEEVARASALRVYEVFRDRPWGSMTVDAEAAGPVEPVGMIDRVSSIMDGGATRTRIDFGLVRQPADIWRYLDGTTRRALLRSQLALADPLSSTVGVL